MTDDNDVPRIFRTPEQQREFEDQFAHVRLDVAWQRCGGSGPPTAEFADAIRDALLRYHPEPPAKARLSGRNRSRSYRKLEKAAQSFLDEIRAVDPDIWVELEDTFTAYEPEDAEALLTGEYEGLSYGEYELDRAVHSLSAFLSTLREAHERFSRPGGRPKQTRNLERTILRLGGAYRAASDQQPMRPYQFDDTDPDHPYKGPFIEFLCVVLWDFNGREYPMNGQLGQAARRVFANKTR